MTDAELPAAPTRLVPATIPGVEPSPSAVLTAEIRALAGVAMLVPARAEVRDVLAHAAGVLAPSSAPVGPLGSVSGGSFAEPVLIRVGGDEVSAAIDVCVAAGSSAPDVARTVGAVARDWCRRAHPERVAKVTVRIASVD